MEIQVWGCGKEARRVPGLMRDAPRGARIPSPSGKVWRGTFFPTCFHGTGLKVDRVIPAVRWGVLEALGGHLACPVPSCWTRGRI